MENQFNIKKKHGAKDRCFKPKDLVYAQIYKNNKMVWIQGSIVERVGKVNYNVYIYDNKTRLIRSHINQLKRRYDNYFKPSESIQLMLELCEIKSTSSSQQQPTDESNTLLPEITGEANPLSTSGNQTSSPLTFSTPIAEIPNISSRPKRNRKAPIRLGY